KALADVIRPRCRDNGNSVAGAMGGLSRDGGGGDDDRRIRADQLLREWLKALQFALREPTCKDHALAFNVAESLHLLAERRPPLLAIASVEETDDGSFAAALRKNVNRRRQAGAESDHSKQCGASSHPSQSPCRLAPASLAEW